MYDKLVAKVNNIDINGLVLKAKYDLEKTNQIRLIRQIRLRKEN